MKHLTYYGEDISEQHAAKIIDREFGPSYRRECELKIEEQHNRRAKGVENRARGCEALKRREALARLPPADLSAIAAFGNCWHETISTEQSVATLDQQVYVHWRKGGACVAVMAIPGVDGEGDFNFPLINYDSVIEVDSSLADGKATPETARAMLELQRDGYQSRWGADIAPAYREACQGALDRLEAWAQSVG